MATQQAKLEARGQDRKGIAGPDTGGLRRGVPARAGTGQSTARLWQQASAEVMALRAALGSQRDDAALVDRQLAALAQTIARIGSTARSLEREVDLMRHYAYHDPLTGLPNRSLLLDRLDRALAQAARRGGQVGLLMLDLDDFKLVNDRFGHDVGDQVLSGVAGRLRAATRDADTVCRYGGDEFVILIPDADGREGVTTVAQKIQSELAAPLIVNGHSIAVRACIGIAVYPVDGVVPMHLLQRADVAMYGAKDDPTKRHLCEDVVRPPSLLKVRRARRALVAVAKGGGPGTDHPPEDGQPGRVPCALCAHPDAAALPAGRPRS